MNNRVLSAPPYAEPAVGFRSRKAAQLCAWFALRSAGQIEKLKLIKLVYLTERAHLEAFEDPMLFDELYSLPHGPICSSTLNGINGVIHEEVWDEFVARNGNIVVAVKAFSRDLLDDLSDEEIGIADGVWATFGHMTASQLRNYTHEHCSEYVEVPAGTRLPITYEDLLSATGSQNASFVDDEVYSFRRATQVLTQV